MNLIADSFVTIIRCIWIGWILDNVSTCLLAYFDLCRHRSYEGEPATRLEAITDPEITQSFENRVTENKGRLIMDGAYALSQGIKARNNGESPCVIAAKFHNTIINMTVEAVTSVSQTTGIQDICLCGGCFQNAILTKGLVRGLQQIGLRPYLHRALSPSDESISLGQLCIGAAHRASTTLNNQQMEK
ncbi:hypothetical protein BVY04_03730 [bacterium M21]|nr:hypothetical protein BVY04_03730 [bacterium M21]